MLYSVILRLPVRALWTNIGVWSADEASETAQPAQAWPMYPEWKLAEMVDLTLLDADRDKDGFVSWVEYHTAANRM